MVSIARRSWSLRFALLSFALAGCAAPVASSVESEPAPRPAAPPLHVAPLNSECDDAGAPAPTDANVPGVYDGGGPVEWTDAGWVDPVYDVAKSVKVTAQGELSVACAAGETMIASGSGCAVNGGYIESNGPSPKGWTCEGAPNVPADGATIIAWVECKRAQ